MRGRCRGQGQRCGVGLGRSVTLRACGEGSGGRTAATALSASTARGSVSTIWRRGVEGCVCVCEEGVGVPGCEGSAGLPGGAAARLAQAAVGSHVGAK